MHRRGGAVVQRDSRDLWLILKLHLLPEQGVLVPHLTQWREQVRPEGVEGLTPRHLALLKHHMDHKTVPEIARLWDVNVQTVRVQISGVRQHMGMKDLNAIADLAQERIEAMLPLLPLTGRQRENTRRPAADLSPLCVPVLRLYCQGATVKRIGKELGLSEATVWSRLGMIREYLGAKDRFEVTQQARRLGLLEASPGEAA